VTKERIEARCFAIPVDALLAGRHRPVSISRNYNGIRIKFDDLFTAWR
jgi:hypothetical protein